jgi:hypothetical protein
MVELFGVVHMQVGEGAFQKAEEVFGVFRSNNLSAGVPIPLASLPHIDAWQSPFAYDHLILHES